MSRLRFKITSRVLGTNIVGGQWSNPNTLYPVPYTGEKQRAKNRARNPEGLEFPRGFLPHRSARSPR
jgi:hypothetical protein